jgi:predicted restriction endonuclease
MQVSLEDVIKALEQLGGEAQSHQIKDRVTKNLGGVPSNYKNKTSFRETIQVIIQSHSIGEKKYWHTNKAVFQKLSRGRFRLINNTSSNILLKIDNLIKSFENSSTFQDKFNLENLDDAREKTISSIVQRRGQTNFREELLKAYKGHCAITGCDVIEALEASHIIPYLGPKTNHIQNGILFRSDIHTLFDLGLIAINELNYKVILAPKLLATQYSIYNDVEIKLPVNEDDYPSKEALEKHRAESNL